jgi:hypothetical protein
MYQPSENPDTLKSTDTINIIDDIFGETEISDSWLDEDAIGLDDYQSTGRNLIKWVYDSRLHTCRMSMVCYAVKVRCCAAPGLIAYLNNNSITWEEAPVRQGTNLNYKDDMWIVRSISHTNYTVVIYNEITNEEQTILIELAENSLM